VSVSRRLFDLIISGGEIVDGTGAPRYRGDLGITGDVITAIGDLSGMRAGEVVDAAGRVVCPGFIDMHTHSDLFVLEQPFLAPKIRQGITTDLLGQDGIAAAPLPPQYLDTWRRHLAGLDGGPPIAWDWDDVASYLAKVERSGPSYNIAFLVPHGNIRMQVMGLDGRTATAAERAALQAALRSALEQGARGMSTGLIYPPCCYANTEELTALCEVLAAYGAPFVVHQRSEGDEIIESMGELIAIARTTGVHLHFSHLKVCGRKNWSKVDAVLGEIDAARSAGLAITFDQYPYTAGSTMLSAILPPWAHAGGTQCLLERLRDPASRARMAREIRSGLQGWDSIAAWAGWDNIVITSVESEANAPYVGKNLREIAELRCQSDPLEAAFDLIVEESNGVGMIDFVIDEEGICRIIAHPAGTIGSDGLLCGKPHPRAYGTFPRVFARYVRERGIISLEEGVRRSTSAPAAVLGLSDRGILREGYKADIVIFDAETIGDTATYADPRRYPTGISHVLVNGNVVVRGEREIPLPVGAVLRRNYRDTRQTADNHITREPVA